MKKLKVILTVSLVFNIIFILTTAGLLYITRNMRAITFFELRHIPYVHSAFIIGVPETAELPIFGTAGIFLRRGEIATVQISTTRGFRQLNQSIQPLFDHSIIAVDITGYGIVIKAINQGETSLQVFSGLFGFRDLLKVIVYE